MKTIINRDFTRLWIGQAVSKVGDYVFDTTLVLWIATKLGNGKSWAPVAVSGVLIAALAATMAIAPAAGVFADRWNRKRTMLRMDAIRAVLVGGLAALAFLPSHTLPIGVWLAVIYLVVFAVNAAGTFFGPSRMAVIPDVVHGDAEIAKASGITQSTDALVGMIGPPLAAPLLFAGGVEWAMVVNALSYVVSFLAIRPVAIPDNTPSATAKGGDSSFWAEFKEGLAFFAKTRVLVVLLIVACTANFGAQVMNTLDVFFTTQNLHADAKLYGLIGLGFGAGAVIGGLVAVRVVSRIGTTNAVWATIGFAGIVMLFYARQSSIWAAIPLIFLAGMPIAMVNSAVQPLIFQVVPRAMLGRVVSVFMPINSVVQLSSTVLVSWLISTVMLHFHAEIGGLHLGPLDTMFTVTGLMFMLSAAYAYVMFRGGVPETNPDAEGAPEAEGDPEPATA